MTKVERERRKRRREKGRRNLAKAIRDYPQQLDHMRYWLDKLETPYVIIGDCHLLGSRVFPPICKLLGMSATEALGTSCTREECMQWHTNADDR